MDKHLKPLYLVCFLFMLFVSCTGNNQDKGYLKNSIEYIPIQGVTDSLNVDSLQGTFLSCCKEVQLHRDSGTPTSLPKNQYTSVGYLPSESVYFLFNSKSNSAVFDTLLIIHEDEKKEVQFALFDKDLVFIKGDKTKNILANRKTLKALSSQSNIRIANTIASLLKEYSILAKEEQKFDSVLENCGSYKKQLKPLLANKLHRHNQKDLSFAFVAAGIDLESPLGNYINIEVKKTVNSLVELDQNSRLDFLDRELYRHIINMVEYSTITSTQAHSFYNSFNKISYE